MSQKVADCLGPSSFHEAVAPSLRFDSVRAPRESERSLVVCATRDDGAGKPRRIDTSSVRRADVIV